MPGSWTFLVPPVTRPGAHSSWDDQTPRRRDGSQNTRGLLGEMWDPLAMRYDYIRSANPADGRSGLPNFRVVRSAASSTRAGALGRRHPALDVDGGEFGVTTYPSG